MRLMGLGGHDPTEPVAAFAGDADALGIDTLHVVIFDSVAETRALQEAILERAARSDGAQR
jgi:hypothetical protein